MRVDVGDIIRTFRDIEWTLYMELSHRHAQIAGWWKYQVLTKAIWFNAVRREVIPYD